MYHHYSPIKRKMNAAIDGMSGGNGGNTAAAAPQNNSQGTPTAPVAPKASWFSNLLGKSTAAPAQPATTTAPTTTAEPTEAQFFADLFAPKTVDPAEANKEVPKTPWDVDGDKLSANFGNLDISAYIKPEQITAALGGDATALMEIFNTSTRISAMAAYKQAMTDAKAGVTHAADGLRKSIPQQFKELSVDNNLRQDQAFSAPEIQPLVKEFKDNMLSKYPNATEADIKLGLSKYLTHLGSLFNSPSTPNTSPTQTSNKIDWDSEFKSLM